MKQHPLFRFSALLPAAFFVLGASLGSQASEKTSEKVTGSIYDSLFSGQRKSDAQQKRSRTNTTVMGIRGLDTDTDSARKWNASANMRAVYDMEDRTPQPEAVDTIRSEIKKQNQSEAETKFTAPVENALPTVPEFQGEIELGRKMAGQILGAYKPYADESVQDYLNALAAVVSNSGLSSARPFRVMALDTNTVNAFACPGGYIFITAGALKNVQSEAQLATMIGHEIVHVSKKHLISSLQKKLTRPVASTESGEKSPHMEQRKRVKPEGESDSATWTQLLGPKGVGLSLLQASSEALETLLNKGLDRELEIEADTLGTQASAATGFYSPTFVSLLSTLESKSKAKTDLTLATHPPYKLRIEKLSQFIASLPNVENSKMNSSSLFLKAQARWMKK